jgi:hypothetical protein
MKIISPIFLFALLVCGGCATHYDMRLTNGSIITSKGKPRVDSKQHLIFFKDASGRTNVIPEFKVTEIAPHSTMKSENQFNQVAK